MIVRLALVAKMIFVVLGMVLVVVDAVYWFPEESPRESRRPSRDSTSSDMQDRSQKKNMRQQNLNEDNVRR